MAEITTINPSNNVTQINSGNNVTQINSASGTVAGSSYLFPPLDIPKDTVLLNKYKVISRIGAVNSSGEADLFLCSHNGSYRVLKVYRREIDENAENLQKLYAVKSPHIAKVHENGRAFERYIEVYTYYERGSLEDYVDSGKTYDYTTLKQCIIPQMNDALRALHSCGLLHRDIKPSNIMFDNCDKIRLILIDFGFVHDTQTSNSIMVSRIAGTMSYSAPEVLRSVYFDESDYYSMGIVLYQLFTGELPFVKGNSYISQITQPSNMPDDLYQLILGLTYNDTSYRHDLNNPNRRWSYDEVNKWLAGEKMITPGLGYATSGKVKEEEKEDSRKIGRYFFCGKDYYNIDELCHAMAVNWDEGKKHIFRRTLYNALASGQNKTENQIYWGSVISDTISRGSDNFYREDWQMMKILYTICPDTNFIYTPLGVFDNLKSFGQALIDGLSSASFDTRTAAQDAVAAIIPTNVFQNLMKNDKKTDFGEAAEILLKEENSSDWWSISSSRSWWLAYLISGEKSLDLNLPDGKKFNSVKELKKYLTAKGNDSYKELYSVCGNFMDESYTMKPALYGWLRARGCDVSKFNHKD